MTGPAGASRDQDAEAGERLSALQREVDRLRQHVSSNQFADQLRRSLIQAGAAAAISSPPAQSQLLMLILETAAHVIRTATASVSVLDEERGELVILSAIGPGAQEAQGLRVPLGHGIAGLVAASGQPMAVSNAAADTRHAVEIAEATGYRPNTILCVPMLRDERVLGVLQVLDKAGGQSFSAADIETLGLFSAQAAIVIEQTRTYADLSTLIRQVLASATDGGAADPAVQAARSFASAVQDTAEFDEALELAGLIQQLVGHGERERRLCTAVLHSLAAYVGSRPQVGFGGQII